MKVNDIEHTMMILARINLELEHRLKEIKEIIFQIILGYSRNAYE